MHRAVLLLSCRVQNLKGSRINQSKAKLQQAFGSHAGSGTVRAHKGPTVSAAALRIPAVYSPRHTHTHHTHTETAHREGCAEVSVCSGSTFVKTRQTENDGDVR